MKKENITIYSCEHCAKISRRSSAMLKHENACRNNPKNINACVGCKFLEVKEENLCYSINNQWNETIVNTFSCSKLKQEMYPAKAKRSIGKYPESFEGKVQMPNFCEHYEVELIEENEF